jgi:hypothetical protein
MFDHARKRSTPRRVLLTVAVVLAGFGTPIVAVLAPAAAAGTYATSAVADNAEAHADGTYGGQCKTFVGDVIQVLSGTYPSGYQQGFANAGAVLITDPAAAIRGDIIQITPAGSADATAETLYNPAHPSTQLHTAIIRGVRNADGTFNVIDSNWSTDNDQTVRRHAFNPYTWASGSIIKIWRFGTPPTPPPPPPPPPTIVDSDGDGTPDASDACPHVYVTANGGCPNKADFSLDGKSDIAAFYNYDGGAIGLWLWNGQSNLNTSDPYSPWGQYDGWDATRLLPAGAGDFNGDKIPDTAAFYAYDGGALGLDVWFGNAQAGLGYHQSWYVPSAWEKDRVIPAGVGDFNGDGQADVAAFYRYDDHLSLYIWYGQRDLSMSDPVSVWWAPGWDGTKVIPVGVGDIDGDGHMDISTFYDHGDGMMDENVWYGDGTGAFTLGRPWSSATGSGWDSSRFIPMGVADINGDGKADTIVIFRHDGDVVDMRTWWGTGSRIMTGEPGGPWSASGWDGSRIIPAGTGDYNGDGKPDIAAFYRYDGQAVGLDIWYGDGNGYMNPSGAWYVGTGWEGARLVPPDKG